MIDVTVLDELIIGRVEPQIYAFSTNTVPNYLKIGDTYRPISVRLNEWKRYFPDLDQQYQHSSVIDGSVYFRDYSIHKYLVDELGKERLKKELFPHISYYSNEFFRETSADDIDAAIKDIRVNHGVSPKYQYYYADNSLPEVYTYQRGGDWEPRPNQRATIDAFRQAVESGRTNLLMYAVMRFGKSFTSLCCATECNCRLVVVLSAKAGVEDEWKKTVESAGNFKNYAFLNSRALLDDAHAVTKVLDSVSEQNCAVVFLTLQDLQGDNIKAKHVELFNETVDLLIVDETHFGARAEKYGQVLRDKGYKKDISHKEDNADFFELTEADEQIKSFRAKVKLHLSGTPYRILMGSEFQKEDIIAFYQFSDIVQAQEIWDSENLSKDNIQE